MNWLIQLLIKAGKIDPHSLMTQSNISDLIELARSMGIPI